MTFNQDFIARNPHLKEFLPFLTEFNSESARGSALVATSYLEKLLEDVLEAFLINNNCSKKLLNGFNAPLGSFSAKIAACSALGLITHSEQSECDLIRKIRNKFAHELKMQFDNQPVADWCENLSFGIKEVEGQKVTPRNTFVTSAVALAARFVNRAAYAERIKLTAKEWGA